jgi:putative NADH-flavin reductase
MKIAVVGATGATGRRVVKHALAQGHFVTAVARHPERLSSADQLSFVRGDVLSPGGLTGALDGVEAVISCIGPEKNPSPERSCQSVSPAFSPNANVRTSDDSYCKVVSA